MHLVAFSQLAIPESPSFKLCPKNVLKPATTYSDCMELGNPLSETGKVPISHDEVDESIGVSPSDPVQKYLITKLHAIKSYKLNSIQLIGYRDNQFTQCIIDNDKFSCPSDNQNEKYNILESIIFNNVADVKYFISYHPMHLTHLSIIDCDFSSSCLAVLLNSMYCTNYNYLNLKNNNIGIEGCILFAKALQNGKLSNLKTLNISSNKLVGVYVLQRLVRGRLNLTGVKELFNALKYNSCITNLDLSHNYLGGINQITSMKRDYIVHTTGKSEDIIEGKYGLLVAEMIKELLLINKTIRYFTINYNGFGDDLITCRSLISGIYSLSNRSLCGVSYSSQLCIDLSYHSLQPINGILLSHELINFCINGSCRTIAPIQLTLNLSNNMTFGCAGASNLLNELAKNINKVSDKLSIQQMVIQESGISVNGVRSICEILMNPKISNVTFLDLSNNDIGAEGLTILSNYPLVTLTKLCLSNCNIICDTEVIGNNIRNLFNSYCNIESIDISHNKLTCMAVPFIINVANCHVKLREINLSFNKIRRAGFLAISCYYKAFYNQVEGEITHSNIKIIDLSGNPCCGKRANDTYDPFPIIELMKSLVPTSVASAISSGSFNSPGNLQSNGNFMTDRSSLCLAGMRFPKLEHLKFNNIDFGARATAVLAKVLQFNNVIHTIELSGAFMNELGAINLGEALGDLFFLRKLIMNSCQIGPLGCQHLMLGLAENKSLEYLDISNNEITGNKNFENIYVNYDIATVVAISNTLAKNSTLKYIDLSNNGLFGLQKNKFHENYISMDAISHICDGIRMNALNNGQLIVINLLENKIDNCPDQCSLECNCGREKHVNELLEVKAKHPKLKSLIGLTYTMYDKSFGYAVSNDEVTNKITGASHLNFSQINLDENLLKIIADEIKYNHYVTHLNLSHTNWTETGLNAVLRAVENNVILQQVSLGKSLCSNILEKESERIDEAFKAAFNLKIGIAIFLRGVPAIGDNASLHILSYLIGDGPQVYKFMKKYFYL